MKKGKTRKSVGGDANKGAMMRLLEEVSGGYKRNGWRYILFIGSSGGLLEETIEDETGLKAIQLKDLPFYPVNEVVVVGDEEKDFVDFGDFRKFGYSVFVLYKDTRL